MANPVTSSAWYHSIPAPSATVCGNNSNKIVIELSSSDINSSLFGNITVRIEGNVITMRISNSKKISREVSLYFDNNNQKSYLFYEERAGTLYGNLLVDLSCEINKEPSFECDVSNDAVCDDLINLRRDINEEDARKKIIAALNVPRIKNFIIQIVGYLSDDGISQRVVNNSTYKKLLDVMNGTVDEESFTLMNEVVETWIIQEECSLPTEKTELNCDKK